MVLAGLSEGAELIPALSAAYPEAIGLVVVGHAGLDPAEAGALQAAKLGQSAAWKALMAEDDSGMGDEVLLEGRHPRYWQVLKRWELQKPLLTDPRPLLQAYGGADELMPALAYQRFADAAHQRVGPFCAVRFPTANHELREPGIDRLQQLWRWLDQTVAAAAPEPSVTLVLQECDAWRAEAQKP